MPSIVAADHVPLYQRIASSFAAQIASGALKVGERLPSERQMAEELGASRMTARQALKLLERRGLVETRTGRGAFVAHPRIEQQLSTLSGFTEEMHRGGRLASSIVLDAGVGAADREAAAALGIAEHAPVHRLVRVRLADAEPVGLERTEIPAALAPKLLERADFSTDSLYRVLREDYGLYPSEAEQKLWSAHPDAASAASLGISLQSPVLFLTRRTLDATGRPIEYVRAVYRGDCFVMRVNLTLGTDT
ncbi:MULTISPECIES: GntR family transcriptional regulator [unclassified Mesorhizobium]|uniref:GntR family transcriptional regulator n=1 Tax=unclassified Mesorhizobium TaxID=325217 RepID=UPI000F75E01A|nr:MULTISPECIES: GntR family transcriptional regulator [unclassified Mesorhizobium]AZO64021.1 GntR family transcriptional regulator [Mesorhizobium sp. M6A.T.Cr.TU.016.01.1.1]RUU31036.1 UTRA domain-containing protein [Mesorhizobium sp. M6A.T.Ce.TU.016.01.1.1]RUU42155.1 UTRA domain-containing protein [Mesorhizobium sp. M6A.T.Ce.TU.002.03.1.1]RVB72899.1 UTRA domain-containing protein [Mesorhizobium sp. M6A.T.Cr.TU.014.01.1.1]RWN32446.1 MAG: UTRA domain-containing protein [Mesorhizobium sp.]